MSLKTGELFLWFLLLCLPGFSRQKPEKFAALMQEYHRFNMFDGAVLVAKEGKVVYSAAFGLANREWNIPNRTNTRFMIGSISKPFTAVLVLMQVQKGLIQLDSCIDHYLPEFKNKPAAKLTIRQLLAHTSGMANYDIIKDFFPRISRQKFTRQQYLQVYVDSPLLFTPGKQYAYSSWGYFTLGYLLETVTHKPYDILMQEQIFKPLHMNNSGSYYHTQVVANRASGYDYSFGVFSSADFRDQTNTMGTGDIYSTVEDIFTFHLALGTNQLLNKELTALMFQPGIEPAHYGFGWFNKPFKYTDKDSLPSNFHLGMTEGFIGFLRRIEANNSLVVILCNSSPTDFFGITNNLYKLLFNVPVHLKQPLHKKLETEIGSMGIAKAMQHYNREKKDTALFYTDWISMNFLAQQLYELKRLDEARMIAESNVQDFPNRDLVMMTMANIYAAQGRRNDAIRFYQKTLAITPTYEEASRRIAELTNGK